jgi:hypothetical protein
MSYIPDRVRQHHHQLHQTEDEPTQQHYCSTCYPRPDTRLISREFRRFWTWINLHHNAQYFNGFTTAAFATLRQQLNTNNPTLSVDELTNLTVALTTSIGYQQPLTPIAELCYYIHYLFERTTGFSTPIRQQDILTAFTTYTNAQTPPETPTQQTQAPITMNQNQLQQTLNTALGQGGLNLPGLTQALQNALTALQNNPQQAPQQQPRELSIVKVTDFHGRNEEDPHEWIDHFQQAADANHWQGNDRLIAIAKGYLKGAAADWANTATAVGVQQRITHWNDNNNIPISFVPRFIEKFAPETKQNKWYYELMTIRQMSTETVDEYSLRFQRLLRKVNVNNLVPAALQVRMYLYGLIPLLTPLVATANPQDLAAAIERARAVETGYNYIPTKEITVQAPSTVKENPITNPANNNLTTTPTDFDALSQQLQQLTLNYANLTTALMAQPTPTAQHGNRREQTSGRNNRPYSNRTYNNNRTTNLTCYNCGKPGHIVRACPEPRKQRQTRFANTRDVHYVSLLDESDEYSTEEEYDAYHYEREVYPATRSGR